MHTYCYGFAWQGFGSSRATGVASVRSCKKLPPCLIKTVSASSKTDPPLPKAKPISNNGSASVITCLRRGRKIIVVRLQLGRGARLRERNNSADTKVSEEGWRTCSRCWSRESSLANHDEDHGEAGFPPAAHGGPHCSRYQPVAHGRDPTPEQMDA